MSHAPPTGSRRPGPRTPVIVLASVLALLGMAVAASLIAGHSAPEWAVVVVAVAIELCAFAVGLMHRSEPAEAVADLERNEQAAPSAGEQLRPDADVDHRMFQPLAARMQSLLLREIQEIDALENQVEDPDLLNALFRVDHLVAMVMRLSETLAALGGQPVQRGIRETVPVRGLIRAAIAEVSRYTQVEIARVVDVRIVPAAHGDLRHVLAELIDNATWASDPDGEPVLVRAVPVPAGLKVTISDHGLRPSDEQYARHNSVLHGAVNVSEVLADGRYGLAVVGLIAANRGFDVSLEPNKFGGTDAVIVVPQQWLATDQPTAAAPALPKEGYRPAPSHLYDESTAAALPKRAPRPQLDPAAASTLPRGLSAVAEPAPPHSQSAPVNHSKPALPQRVPGHSGFAEPVLAAAESTVQRNAFDPDAIGQVRDTLTGRSASPATTTRASEFAYFWPEPQGSRDDEQP